MEPKAFGIGDIELGIKYRFVQESKHRPMIRTFVMFELPSGNADKGLGGVGIIRSTVARAAGLAEEVDTGDGGFLSRSGRRGHAVQSTLTLLDAGGYYKFRDPGFHLLFCYGHSVIGDTENYAYRGLYWTWPKKNDDPDKPGDASDKTNPREWHSAA